MKALSVRAPWWWYILHAGKDIENRDWYTGVRGRVYVHASKRWDAGEVDDAQYWVSQVINRSRSIPAVPHLSESDLRPSCGCIVGTVEIVDCVSASGSRWFMGKYGLVLRDPIAFPRLIPFRGALKFFEVPNGIEVP